MNSLLQANGISKRFEGTQALHKVDFSVESGEVHALMGENGAGKSTLAKILAGVVLPDEGEIVLGGEKVTIRNPQRARELGIGIVFQELDLFPHLTIAENMALANSATGERWAVRPRRLHAWCAGFLAQVKLNAHPDTPVGQLSIGQAQLVAIARALSLQARLLILDEPTSALAEDGARNLFEVISQLKRNGVSIVYVTHKMEEVQRIADRITVLRDGTFVGTASTKDLSMQALITMMVGRELERHEGKRRAPRSDVLLEVRGVGTKFLSDVTFELRAGEVLGIAGLVGSGRSELGAALFGLRKIQRGEIKLNGRVLRPISPAQTLRESFCLLPEDRRDAGLFPQMSVGENATIGVLHKFAWRGFLNKKEERKKVEEFARRLSMESPADLPVASLSGGNQQKVIFARWLMAEPRLLFLDEPTRGIDIAAKETIYRIIDDFATQGRAVILVSSELAELLRCCDRILVLRDGVQSGIVATDSTTQEQILGLATGLHPAAT